MMILLYQGLCPYAASGYPEVFYCGSYRKALKKSVKQ